MTRIHENNPHSEANAILYVKYHDIEEIPGVGNNSHEAE